MAHALPYFIIIPLASAFAISAMGKRLKVTCALTASGAAALLASLSLALAWALRSAPSHLLACAVGNWMPPAGIPLVADSVSAFMLVTVNIVAFMVAVYSTSYMRPYTDTWKFYSLFSLMLAGINGVLIAGDIFNLYVFLEITAIAGYFLVAFGTEAEELEASFKYAVMGSVASIFILLGIAFLYSSTSTLNMADMAGALSTGQSAKTVLFVSVLFLMGFGLKAALVPFHSWLPYAHSAAPAPISAMLSGVSIKVIGIYALMRIFFCVFGITSAVSSILIALGLLSMVVASVLAFGQSDIKRLFAYSSISQVGYIALGLGIATPLSIMGAFFYLFNHSISKSLLFLNSGSIERLTGTRDLNKISSIVERAPVTGYTNMIGSFSVCGVPPFGGFWGKLIIIFACIKAGHPIAAFIAAGISVMTLAYYFKALTPALFSRPNLHAEAITKKISPAMAIPMVILACLSAVSFVILLPNAGNELLKDASSVLVNGKAYAAAVWGALR